MSPGDLTRGRRARLCAGAALAILAPLPPATLAAAATPAAALPRGPAKADSIGQIADRLGACWRPPTGLARVERLEQTVRLSLRQDGTLLGEPRVTFVAAGADSPVRDLMVRSALEAVRRCTPVPMTAGLAGSLAGRPFTIRLIYTAPRGRGA